MSARETSPIELRLPRDAEVLASGLGFTEGPVPLGTEAIAIVSVNRGHIYRVQVDGGEVTMLADVGGGPNGLAVGAHGSLWIAQNGATAMASKSSVAAIPSIQRLTSGGLEAFAIGQVTAPSDCAFDARGRLWFTDPTHLTRDGAVLPGALRIFDPATGEVTLAADDLLFPNGLTFGPDGESIYVAETARTLVRRFTVGDDCRADGWAVDLHGVRPDGIALDAEGWLWVATGRRGSVMAFDPEGELRDEINFGDRVLATNVAFAGPGLSRMVVTIVKGGTVAALPARYPGVPPLIPVAH